MPSEDDKKCLVQKNTNTGKRERERESKKKKEDLFSFSFGICRSSRERIVRARTK
jgi:hypothetical protein